MIIDRWFLHRHLGEDGEFTASGERLPKVLDYIKGGY